MSDNLFKRCNPHKAATEAGFLSLAFILGLYCPAPDTKHLIRNAVP
jgi:hypothetical protein